MARPVKAPSQSSPRPLAPSAPLARPLSGRRRRQRSPRSLAPAPTSSSSSSSTLSLTATAAAAASTTTTGALLSLAPSPLPPALTRRRHTNSKLGCANCKRKKIRCDEQLPQCGKCARGKREVCLYLLLSQAEIQRIRLIHSLRNSQNKLLELEYRLPALASAPGAGQGVLSGALLEAALGAGVWSGAAVDHNNLSANNAGAALEFVHEGTDLPPLPQYGELRFVAVGETDFERDLTLLLSAALTAPAVAPAMVAPLVAPLTPLLLAPVAPLLPVPVAPLPPRVATAAPPMAPLYPRPAPRTLPVPGLAFVPTPIPPGLPVQKVAKLAINLTRVIAREFPRPLPPLAPQFNTAPGQIPLPALLVQLRNILPGGYYQPCRFPKTRRKPRDHYFHNYSHEHHRGKLIGRGPCLIGCSHFRIGKFSLLEHISAMLELKQQPVGGELAWGCLLYIGALAVLNTLRKKLVYYPQFSANIDYVALSQALGVRARKLGQQIRRQFTTHIQLLVLTWHEFADIKYLQQTMMALGFSFLLVVLVADLLFEEYYEVSEKWAVMIKEVGKFAEVFDTNLRQEGENRLIAGYSVHQIGHNISGLRVPPYPPQFVSELVDNFVRLEPMFLIPLARFSQCQAEYTELQYEYSQLLDYLRDLGTVVTTLAQDKDTMTVYPFPDIWRLLKSWHRKVPTGALAFNPKRIVQDTDERQFICDLKATLYMYYQATLVALEAIFPCTKYLCTTQFMAPSHEFFRNKAAMTPRDTPFHALVGPRTTASLQKHNYYAMRLYSFFKHRYLMYHQYIQWTQPFPELLRRHRFKLRAITNAHEVPISLFNNTLIRPEHYPTKEKHTPVTEHGSFLTRTDETMDNQVYSRNIERLNLFQLNVQFDYGTMMLLSDYRYDDSQLHFHDNELTVAGFVEFYEDRVLLLRDAMGWTKPEPS